jgi:hypothetical protein
VTVALGVAALASLGFALLRPTPAPAPEVTVRVAFALPTGLAQTTSIRSIVALSPDGRWLAYVTNETGADQTVVQPFPGPGVRTTVSVAGCPEPVWSRDGRYLFYRDDERFWRVVVGPGGGGPTPPAIAAYISGDA